jgi:hypothetical protein
MLTGFEMNTSDDAFNHVGDVIADFRFDPSWKTCDCRWFFIRKDDRR